MQGLLQPTGIEIHVDRLFREAKAHGVLGVHGSGKFQGSLKQVVAFNESACKPKLHGFLCGHEVAREHELVSSACTDEPGKKITARHVRAAEADVDVGGGKTGIRADHSHVRGHGKAESEAGACAVHGTDDGLRRAPHGQKEPGESDLESVVLIHGHLGRAFHEISHVEAGAESLVSVTAQDDHMGVQIVEPLLPETLQFLHHLVVHGIVNPRPVQ